MSEGKKKADPVVALLTGAIAGGVEATAVWPMEYMKTQLQLHGKTAKPPFKGVWDGIAYTYRTTGFFSLYSGLSITLLFSIPKAGIRFGGNAWCKKALADVDGKLTVGRQFLAGFGAGVIEAVAAVTPMESIKTFAIEKNAGLVSAVKGIVQTSGLKGLYKGVVPTVAKQASNQGLRFMFYNYYKDLYTQDGKRPLPPLGALLGGMLAGCFSTTCNNPFDVVKTRMQGSNSHQYTSMIDCVWKIYANEGLWAFYSGYVARLYRVVPGQGIIFFSFETLQGCVGDALDAVRA